MFACTHFVKSRVLSSRIRLTEPKFCTIIRNKSFEYSHQSGCLVIIPCLYCNKWKFNFILGYFFSMNKRRQIEVGVTPHFVVCAVCGKGFIRKAQMIMLTRLGIRHLVIRQRMTKFRYFLPMHISVS